MRTRTTVLMSLAATAFLLTGGPACAQGAAAKLLPAQSSIGFVSKQMGVPVEGVFKKFDAQITLDPKAPETGKVMLTIDTNSATLGVAETDAELAKPGWFNVAKFPQATFQSTAIKGLGGGKFQVAGTLTIKGTASNVTVPVAVTQSGGTSTATGNFTIKRVPFKIGDGEWNDTSLVADDVVVKFKLALTGLPPV